jgi:hypothetical protein
MNFTRLIWRLPVGILFLLRAEAQTSSEISTFSGPKTFLFSRFPEKTACNPLSLDPWFETARSGPIQLAPGLRLHGQLLSRVKQNIWVESLIIQLTEFPGTQLTISRIKGPDGSLRYSGRILGPGAADALILSLENGKYYLMKTTQRLVLTD